jgi:hypothetical protein
MVIVLGASLLKMSSARQTELGGGQKKVESRLCRRTFWGSLREHYGTLSFVVIEGTLSFCRENNDPGFRSTMAFAKSRTADEIFLIARPELCGCGRTRDQSGGIHRA